jgi:hypothetical protein
MLKSIEMFEVHVEVKNILQNVYIIIVEHVGITTAVGSIFDKTLETIPTNTTKLLHIKKTNFVSPSPQLNFVNNAETASGNITYHDTCSTLSWGSGGLRRAT